MRSPGLGGESQCSLPPAPPSPCRRLRRRRRTSIGRRKRWMGRDRRAWFLLSSARCYNFPTTLEETLLAMRSYFSLQCYPAFSCQIDNFEKLNLVRRRTGRRKGWFLVLQLKFPRNTLYVGVRGSYPTTKLSPAQVLSALRCIENENNVWTV